MSSKFHVIKPGSTIGIIGGGQLGRMIAVAGVQLGYKTHIFTPNANASAVHVTNNVTVGDFNDHYALVSFAKSVDVVTFEFENIPSSSIDILMKYVNVYPNKEILYIAQNRLREKEFISKKLNIPVAEYELITNFSDLKSFIKNVGYPVLLKSTELGYDGKGQFLIKNDEDLKKLACSITNANYTVEKFVKIYKEISLIIAMDTNRNFSFFPIAENFHTKGILDRSIVPADITQDIYEKAHEITKMIALNLNLIGILAVEFFITTDNILLVNEIAPRPHNSGHWTLDACNISQFEQLVRAICHLPLKLVKLLFPCTMKNILGQEVLSYNSYLRQDNSLLYIYGKDEIIENRKMGHVNIVEYENYLVSDKESN